ncbi:MAG TPA: glycosyltransferase family 4 protein [Phycicoccus sp.]|jgi:glycosyltransferase involved in cell wall biosynthesis|nr:glycosyltransferase family 4 protein [Phycicoccus sp.]HQK31281.1 glycosyltransferase family 4 protein [Phycicoccus sp.]HQY97268.1 glycosyltransferase family 4 protein [Phycicoccus sp.]HRA46054.1 glycosyltransferase family 4 protein [Phycicoccus sp.]
MKVLLVLGTSTGGVGRHVHDLVEGLVAAGDEVVVAAPVPVSEQFGYADAGAHVVPLEFGDRPHPVRDLAALRRLREIGAAADVVHAHGVRAGALAALALRGVAPLVVTLHNAAPESRAAAVIHGSLEAIVARGAALVLGVSSDLVEGQRRRRARRAELAVVPAAVPPGVIGDRFGVRQTLDVAPTTALLVTIARLAPQKDLDLLLDAMARLQKKSVVPALAVIAGEGPLRDHLEQRIRSEALPVRLLGHRRDVPDLLAAADIVVSTARWEGQPVALQEALHLGAAIVATDAGGTKDVVGDAAILVPVGDAESLTCALADVLTHGGVRDDLRSKAMHRAGELPTKEAAIAAARTAYASVVD